MNKYDYKGASVIWNEFYTLVCEPWEFDENERQQTRRYFMRTLTRKKGFGQFLDVIKERTEEEYIDKKDADILTDKILSFVIA